MRPGRKPRYLDECWQLPWWPLDSLAAIRNLCIDGRDPSFLFLPMSDWHARIQRSQHLALSLAGMGHWCFYLNPQLGRQFEKIHALDGRHRIAFHGPRLAELHLRLPREPVHHHRMLTRAENRTLTAGLRTVVQARRGAPLIQVVSLPTWLEAAKELKAEFHCPIIYDCHDLIEGFRDMDSEIVNAEKELMRVCDCALFSSLPLMEMKLGEFPELKSRSVLLRNAADLEHFSQAYLASPPHRAFPEEPRLIGYVGSLDDWFDIECVEYAARRYPGWRFRLIGRIEYPEIKRLRHYANVEFYGEIPYANLPAFLMEFDAALIPFRRNALTTAVNPIKLYEYFSCGLPVVSTRLPEVERYAGLVYLADNPADFAAQLAKAVTEDSAELRRSRHDAVLGENWNVRAEQLRDIALGLCAAPVSRAS